MLIQRMGLRDKLICWYAPKFVILLSLVHLCFAMYYSIIHVLFCHIVYMEELNRFLGYMDAEFCNHMPKQITKFDVIYPEWVPVQAGPWDCGLYACLMMHCSNALECVMWENVGSFELRRMFSFKLW